MSAAPVQLLVGLGNPGPKYTETRHNAGFWFIQALAQQAGVALRSERKFQGAVARWREADIDLHLLCPLTYMNHSGRSVAAFTQFHRIDPSSLLVAHDEIDLPVGEVRLKHGGGHGGHNGLRDMIAALGTREFMRLRIGVGHPGTSDQVVQYVLHAPGKLEREAIDRSIAAALAQVPELLAGQWARAQQALHTQ